MDTEQRSTPLTIRGFAAGFLIVGVLLSLAVGWSVIDARRAAWSGAAATSVNLATTLGSDITDRIETADAALQAAVGAVAAGVDPRSASAFATPPHMGADDGGIGPLVVLDAAGRVISVSDMAIGPAPVMADRDYFLVHQRRTVDGLFISHPYQSRRTHEWSIALSRRLNDRDGRFAGVVLAPIRYSYFQHLLSTPDVAAVSAVSVLDDSGTMLYRVPFPNDTPGHDAVMALDFGYLRGAQMQPFDAVSPWTGRPTLFAVSRIGNLPLLLSVETPLSAVYVGWTVKTVLMSATVLVLLLAGGLLLRALRRQQQLLLRADRRELETFEQVRRETERQHTAKMEAVGRLTAGVAHDFNNYLQTIISSLEIISADYLAEPEAKEIAHIAHKAASNGAKLTHRLLTFSRQQVLQPRRVSVTFLLSDLRKLIADSRIFEAAIQCKIAVEPFTDDLQVDATQVESCLLNLLLNARDAMPHGGTLHLEGRNAGPQDRLFGSLTPGRHVILTVRDSGRGMDEATRRQAFEPFFTTKAFGKGAGLGLSTAQGFCHQSGGDIRILDNRDQPGTTVELWLPAAAPETPAEEEVEFNYATIGRRTGRVLLVEDKQDVLVALSAILISGGFEVVSVNNGAEGLMRLHDREPFDAVLTDHVMPDMDGVEFLSRVAAEIPGLPMLILSGSEVNEAACATLPHNLWQLRKPIRRMGLLNAVREAIGERNRLLVS